MTLYDAIRLGVIWRAFAQGVGGLRPLRRRPSTLPEQRCCHSNPKLLHKKLPDSVPWKSFKKLALEKDFAHVSSLRETLGRISAAKIAARHPVGKLEVFQSKGV